jgi:hypothetical protein
MEPEYRSDYQNASIGDLFEIIIGTFREFLYSILDELISLFL